MLSTHLAMPREGHLQQAYHMFAYLKAKPKKTLAFNSQHPQIDESRFIKCDWHDFYRGVKEPIPGDAPEPRGNLVSTHCFVDADHAGNLITRRSQSGILLFVNRAPILWYSKKQNTVETSTFGSEFVAMRIAVELIESLRYKLRMFGIPIDGPTNVYCDNEAVTKNAIFPESTLKKKHNSIAYHRTREAVAAGTIRVTKEDGKTNLADVLTKLLPQATKIFSVIDLCIDFWPRLSVWQAVILFTSWACYSCGLPPSRFDLRTSRRCLSLFSSRGLNKYSR
jgi:hypothetical protein